MSYAKTEMLVLQWAEARGLVKNSTPYAQALKTKEELDELFEAIAKGDRDEMADAYADILITLVVGCACADHQLRAAAGCHHPVSCISAGVSGACPGGDAAVDVARDR